MKSWSYSDEMFLREVVQVADKHECIHEVDSHYTLVPLDSPPLSWVQVGRGVLAVGVVLLCAACVVGAICLVARVL
jgi:hypothetical protein